MTMNQQAALERQRALYREKNAHLGKYLEPVEPFEFYREIFPEGSFERRGHFEDAKGNGIALVVPPKNGVALEIQGDGKAHRHVITDELKELEDIMSYGQNRSKIGFNMTNKLNAKGLFFVTAS